jgi:PAS domain S-box-containing protein
MTEARRRDGSERASGEAGTEYRDLLERRRALVARLSAASEALSRTLRIQPPSRARLAAALVEVARHSSRALEVGRASIWLIDATGARLRCTVHLLDGVELPVEGVELETEACASYLRALRESNAVAVEDTATDPRTRELGAYLRERGVGALLDIPVASPTGLLGVVCHEHTAGPRAWAPEEVAFASHTGDLVALALETERRLTAEYAAKGTEAKYRHLVETLPVVVYSFDVRSGKLDYVSPRVHELSGWDASEWLAAGAQSWVEHILPEDRPDVLARFEIGVGAGFPEEITYRVRVPDGSLRYIRDTCGVVRDHLGHPVALQGTLSDITRQTVAELERRELERHYRASLDGGELHAVMLDAQGSVTWVNDYFCRVTGFARERVVGADWFELTAPEDARARLAQQHREDLVRGAIAARLEATLRTASGESRQVLWTNTILRGADGAVVGTSSLGVDLTQRVDLENQLLEHTKLESLGRLAAGVAHDFNNLLAIMMAQTALIRGALAGEAEQAAHRGLTDAMQQAAELTRSLLLYGRSQPAADDVVTIDELIAESSALIEAIAGPELEATVTLASHGARVRIDRGQLRQILLNLVGNAADATRDVGRRISIETSRATIADASARPRGAANGGDFAVVAVSDDGRGMDPRTLGRVFDPFFTTKTDGRGTGLGLSIVRSVVARAGGFVEVESEPNRGTTFRVFLPAHGARPSSSGVAPRSSPASRILVVEDELAIRKVLVAALEGAGYDVLAAEDVSSAARILASETIGLLITDGHLPDGSGTVLARSARSAHPELRVILVSGSEPTGGFDGALSKPFDTAALLALVRRLTASE